MKVSDLIAEYLRHRVRHVFAVSGGANLHILDSLARAQVPYICPQTEQAAGFAADAQSRLGFLGCALATSGPGATNLITAIAASYYDSVPVLYLTGQQSRPRLDTQGCRQIGFQQTPIVDMVRPVTKYAVTVMDPLAIVSELDMALAIARSDRPGPVLVDIPDDLQREQIDPAALSRYQPEPRGARDFSGIGAKVLRDLHHARRPVLIYGWGIRLAGAVAEARAVAAKLGIPVAATWAALDAFPGALCFGTHGTKAGNLAVQGADYILAVGTRLDTKATSSPVSLFAPGAKLSMVDVDGAELAKMARNGRPLHRSIEMDARQFLRQIELGVDAVRQHEGSFPDWGLRSAQVEAWRTQYEPGDTAPPPGCAAPYAVVRALAAALAGNEIIVSDTGNTLAWLMQGFRFRAGQRFLHPFNQTPMGYALPAALGASLAEPGRRVVCVTGDGSAMMAIGELATIAKHGLDVRVLLLNNGGHAMCRYTQRQWLGGRFAGTGLEDLAFPADFRAVARSLGGWRVAGSMEELLAGKRPAFLQVMIDPEAALAYQVRFGKALDEGDENAL